MFRFFFTNGGDLDVAGLVIAGLYSTITATVLIPVLIQSERTTVAEKPPYWAIKPKEIRVQDKRKG